MQRGVLQALNPLFNRVTFTRGIPRGKQNVVKKRSFTLRDCWKSITRHRYRPYRYISEMVEDRWVPYMLRGVWPALNSFSIHVTFTAIVLGAYTGRPKCAKDLLKWRTFGLSGWITGKRFKIDGYMLRWVWQALNPLSFHVTFTAIVSGAYPGEAKMYLRLLRLKASTCGVTLVR